MNLSHLDLSSLIPFAENPRRVTDADRRKLRESIESFGLFKPLLIWEGTDHPDGVTGPIVIGGNQRLHVLRVLAEEKALPLRVEMEYGTLEVDPAVIPCVRFPGNWVQAKIIALRDNSQEGDWDWDALPGYVEELGSLLEEAGDEALTLSLTGFDPQTLSDLEAMAGDALMGLDRFGSSGDGEGSQEGQEGSQEGQGEGGSAGGEGEGSQEGQEGSQGAGSSSRSELSRQGARIVLGNIRGKLDLAVYETWAGLIKGVGHELNTTDINLIMAEIAEKAQGGQG